MSELTSEQLMNFLRCCAHECPPCSGCAGEGQRHRLKDGGHCETTEEIARGLLAHIDALTAENERLQRLQRAWVGKEYENVREHIGDLLSEIDALTADNKRLKAYADKLVEAMPGLPQDLDVLRTGNTNLAKENAALTEENERLRAAVRMSCVLISGTAGDGAPEPTP
jgi:regulator of replication initiation timing